MTTTNAREPRVHPVPILSLRPTQMTVGMREVKEKRKRWREHGKNKQADLLGKHMIPVVYGPDARYYVIDHHHLGRALHDEGVKEVLVTIVGDLRMVEREAFWGVMDNKRWVYPYDAKGERRSFRDLPKSVADLKDDPFRSLAGELRRMGGFAKDTTPFSEFLWADFLRRQVSRKAVEADFDKALEKAMAAARSKNAIYLPGWCGPADDD
ncbi:ParB-like protein [Bradyrhizobium sp. CB1015]|uniref:ParB-like protein n=1 Tax=Bradyrhizobium sp. CB1015 TaxID=2976822 RepID=UPI0021AA1D95|nr:ParB-like protein [Bradyrhizobium sp. CB1015]UWU88688.1 chromosome partitioning protein ParB [Bradyrhizobium sp. CB1015]